MSTPLGASAGPGPGEWRALCGARAQPTREARPCGPRRKQNSKLEKLVCFYTTGVLLVRLLSGFG